MHIDNEHLTDTVDLKTGWIGEDEGMYQWPKLYFCNLLFALCKKIVEKKCIIYRLKCTVAQ